MSSFLEMDWTGKWDWENLVMLGSKVGENPKKLQLTDWGIEDEGEMDVGSFNMSASGSGSRRSGSDLGNGSSTKSSLSASIDSCPRNGMKSTGLAFQALKGSTGDFNMKAEPGRCELSGTSPLDGSIASREPHIGLKLGNYFENSYSGGNAKSPSSVIPISSTPAAKKMKTSSPGTPIPRCQVEGCNLDLSSAKEYHRKHRVCDGHSKCPKVIIGGLERRFCQQCSRFHGLSEFDEKKRSCRRRLSDHNARRRKPQQEILQFSSRLPSSFYDSREPMSFVLNPLVQTRNGANQDWETTCSPKFTITRAFPTKTEKVEAAPGQPRMLGSLPYAISMPSNTSNGFLALKGPNTQITTQVVKDSFFSPSVDAAPEFRRALSLLSTNSWGSCEPESVSLDDQVNVTRTNMPQTVMHAIPHGLPLASPEYCWLNGHQSANPRVHSFTPTSDGSGHYEGIQVFKTSFGTDFYQSPLE